MADIELVIKIPEEKYRTIINHTEEILDESSFIEPKYLYRAVLDGTPIPKGHGKIIDVNDLLNRIGLDDTDENREDNVGEIITLEDIDFIPTIIEAESEDKE